MTAHEDLREVAQHDRRGEPSAAVPAAAPAAEHHSWMQPVVAIVISAAGLMTSWSSYQAALWDGEQAAHYGLAGARRVAGARAALDASLTRATEIGLFSAWLQAEDAGNTRLAAIYSGRFPPNLKPAFEDWIAQQPFSRPGAAPTPFRMPSYRQPGLAEAAALDAQAEAEFEAGQRANDISDAFTRGAVILAMSMFFGGIAQVFDGRLVRMALAAVSAISCVIGLWRIFHLPMLATPALN